MNKTAAVEAVLLQWSCHRRGCDIVVWYQGQPVASPLRVGMSLASGVGQLLCRVLGCRVTATSVPSEAGGTTGKARRLH